jgi:monofunctional biosynthetic peptidoglycan transglycosylase
MLRRIGRIIAFFVTGFFIWSLFLVIAYGVLPPAATPLMLLRLLDGSGIHKSWRPLEEISPNLVLAAMAAEDSRFCAHDGFDWKAIREDWQRNQRGGQLLGASTISMQTAKNLFLWPDRSWPRKGLEVYFTLLIELAWPKRRIMELYLNEVEWAPGIYGAEAAAQFHFHKPASALSVGEAARLAAVLPNPRRWSASHPSAYIVARSSIIDARMAEVPAAKPLPCGWPGKAMALP